MFRGGREPLKALLGGGGGGGSEPWLMGGGGLSANFFSYTSFHAIKTQNGLLISFYIQIMLKCSKTTFNIDVEGGGGGPRNLGWWGGGGSANSINRAASRSFYVVEV